MHRFPKLFSSNKSKSKQMESKSQPTTPTTKHTPRKLVRKNASKNINYHPPSTSAPTSAPTSAYTPDDDSLSIRNRSIDVYPWGDRTSFRISGKEGELERLFNSLGLNGPDEFGIDPEEFEAMKARSGDLSGRIGSGGGIDGSDDDDGVGSVILGIGGSREYEINAVCDGIEVSDDFRVGSAVLGVDKSNEYEVAASVDVSSVSLGVNSSRDFGVNGSVAVKLWVGGEVLDDSRGSSVYLGIDRSDEFDVKLRDGGLEDGELCSEVVKEKAVLTGGRSVGVGIKGERPPAVLLSQPPSLLVPVVDDPCTSWDMLRPFGPADGMIVGIEGENGGASSDDERERGSQGDGLEVEDDVVRSSNLNDDDSSSTTTDPMSISPNGILRRRISLWEKGKLLGRGSFGSVYEGVADGGFFFAVKEVSLLDQGDKGREIIYQFEQEMALLSQFEHKNIVRYLGTDRDDSNLYIFLELAYGSLLSLYQRFLFRDSHVSVYTRQILEGLKYLHERSVVHRDIKCANILMDVDGNAKLADFGLAKVDTLNDAKSCKGTTCWMAPEVVQPNKGYGRPADIWSLGCTVLEMLTQNFPYHPLNGFQAMFQIGNGKPPPVPNALSRDARDFILKCLQVVPETRPSAAELLEHPFVKKPHPASTTPHHHGMQA